MTQRLRIDQIELDMDVQARKEISEEVVNDYAELLAADPKFDFPPVRVLRDDDGRHRAGDGFHRLLAYRKAGRSRVPADVVKGDKRDAILFAVGANAGHGLRRSNADKRRAVEILLADEEWAKWSSREIARRCCVSESFVRLMRSAEAEPHCAPCAVSGGPDDKPAVGDLPGAERTYTTKHGTVATMKTGSIGRPAEQQQPPRMEGYTSGEEWACAECGRVMPVECPTCGDCGEARPEAAVEPERSAEPTGQAEPNEAEASQPAVDKAARSGVAEVATADEPDTCPAAQDFSDELGRSPVAAGDPPLPPGTAQDGSPVPVADTVRDHFGREVPERIAEAFRDVKEFRSLIYQIGVFKSRVTDFKAKQSLGVALLRSDVVTIDMDNAAKSLRFSMPYATCPSCDARFRKEDCVCSGRGWVDESTLGRLPEAMRAKCRSFDQQERAA